MSSLSGYVEKIVYRNSDNGYTVLTVADKSDETTCVGTFQYIGEGEYIEMEGEYMTHPSYGDQFAIKSYAIKEPEDEKAIIRYLGSGAIKGVGAALADRIVRHFKEDTFRVIEEEPERLAEVKGISKRMALEIADQLEEKKDMRKAMIFLQQYGISMNLSVKIYKKYGQDIYVMIKKNPYKLADDIQGIGFKIADEIAMKAGFSSTSDFRIKSGITYLLSQAGMNGHAYLPQPELEQMLKELLMAEEIDVEKYLMDLVIDKKIVVKKSEEGNRVYSGMYYYAELNIAAKLRELDIREDYQEKQIEKKINEIQENTGIELDELQKRAVMEAVNCGILLISGGPGTGKTTTIRTIIHYFENQGMEILLAAPTGRAAKRMTEATGHEAQTIHRLLEISGGAEENDNDIEHIGMRFERNETNPLETDVVIIDEMSMVDMFLMNALLHAIMPGTKLILVGDVNQLPSVGPGNVLRDIISSHCYNVVMLTRIFRQAAQSGIIVNAHKINDGEQVQLDNKTSDFLFIRRTEANQIISAVITLVKEKLPKYVQADISEIQVLTPMRKGALGVERLNEILQQYLNPASPDKKEKEHGAGLFREGDKVMQIKNNYQTGWEKRGKHDIVLEQGMGVFNGDMGIIRKINTYAELLEVEFEEGKFVTYPFKQLDELELAYAITIHKSQGSEYPAIVLPLLSGPRMLMNRNLLYTGVTRAKKCVCIVGIEQAVQNMAENEQEQKRYSSLDERIRELDKQEEF